MVQIGDYIEANSEPKDYFDIAKIVSRDFYPIDKKIIFELA